MWSPAQGVPNESKGNQSPAFVIVIYLDFNVCLPGIIFKLTDTQGRSRAHSTKIYIFGHFQGREDVQHFP